MFFHLEKNSTDSIHKNSAIQKYNEVVDNLSVFMSLIQAALEEIQFQQSEQWYQDFLRLQNTTKNTEMDTIIKHYNDIVLSRLKKNTRKWNRMLN